MKVLPPVTDEDQMLCGLAYPLWPIAPFFVLKSVKREDPFICFHAYQGLAFGGFSTAGFFIVFAVLMVMFRILPGSSTLVPGVLGIGVFLGGWIAFLAIICLSLFLGWRASAGEMLKLPLIGAWAEERMIANSGMTRDEFVRTLEEPPKPVLPAQAVAEEAPWESERPPAQSSAASWQAQQQYAQARQQHAQRPPAQQQAPDRQPQATSHPHQVPSRPPQPQAQPRQHQPAAPTSHGDPGITRPVWPKVATSPAQPPPAQVPPQRPDPSAIRAQRMRAAPPQPAAERPLGQENNLLRQWLSSVDDD